MTEAGLKRLYDFQQHGDGGWGWWKEGDSDHWMTAYVVWGLSLARDAGVKVKKGCAQSRGKISRRTSGGGGRESGYAGVDAARAYSVYIIPYKHNSGLLGKYIGKAQDNLWTRRNDLERLHARTVRTGGT